MGDLAITTMEVEDPTRIRPAIAGGTPYDEWWLDYLRDVHGVDLRNIPADQQPSPPPLVFDWPPA